MKRIPHAEIIMEVPAVAVPVQAAAPPKPPRRPHFAWTEAREFTLVNLVFKEKGHLRTDVNLQDKFDNVSRRFMLDASLGMGNALNGYALKKKWDRLSGAVEVKYALLEEGANLSGLPEEPTPTEQLILNMLKQKFDMTKSKEEQKAKDAERNKKMLTHEKNILAWMDRKEEPVDESPEEIDGSITKKRKGGPAPFCSPTPVQDFEVEILNALKGDPRLVEIEIDERKMKMQIANEDRAHIRELEKMKLISEDRVSIERAKADQERAKADFAAASAQQLMMDFISKNCLQR